MCPDDMGRQAYSLVSCLYGPRKQRRPDTAIEQERHKIIAQSILQRGKTRQPDTAINLVKGRQRKNKPKLKTAPPIERTPSEHGIFTGVLASLQNKVVHESPRRLRMLSKEVHLSQISLETSMNDSSLHNSLSPCTSVKIQGTVSGSSFVISLSLSLQNWESFSANSTDTTPLCFLPSYGSKENSAGFVGVPKTPDLLHNVYDYYSDIFDFSPISSFSTYTFSPMSLSTISEEHSTVAVTIDDTFQRTPCIDDILYLGRTNNLIESFLSFHN